MVASAILAFPCKIVKRLKQNIRIIRFLFLKNQLFCLFSADIHIRRPKKLTKNCRTDQLRLEPKISVPAPASMIFL